MRALRLSTNVAVWLLGFACVGFPLAVGVGPRTGRYATLTVLSGSMRPHLPAPNQVKVGQIITYAIPEGDRHVVSHRVVEVVRDGDRPVIRTQGDANNAPDPWLSQVEDDTVWQVRYAVPYVGG